MTLLLFDIDGTLMQTHGVGRRSVCASLAEITGRDISTDGISFSGKTDPQILREVLVANGLGEAEARDVLDDAIAAYTSAMHEQADAMTVTILPGVERLLDRLAQRDDTQLAVLTGNVEPMADLKLRRAGLQSYFPFGAFGSDSSDRYQLPPFAVERAKKHTGRAYEGDAVVLIGDTEHDLQCGRSIGARAIGVCTGHFDRAHLSQFESHALFDDLGDADAFVASVYGSASENGVV